VEIHHLKVSEILYASLGSRLSFFSAKTRWIRHVTTWEKVMVSDVVLLTLPKRLHMPCVQKNSTEVIHHLQSHGAGDINSSLSRSEFHSEH